MNSGKSSKPPNAPETVPAHLEGAANELKILIMHVGAETTLRALLALMKSKDAATLFPDLNARPSFFLADVMGSLSTIIAYNTPYDPAEDEEF